MNNFLYQEFMMYISISDYLGMIDLSSCRASIHCVWDVWHVL